MKYFLTLLLVVFSATVFAQSATAEKEAKEEIPSTTPSNQVNKTIAGTVSDIWDNSRIPGVNVLVLGTTQGTMTDNLGHFWLYVPEDSELVLLFTFIGYQPQAVPLTSATVYDVQLTPDIFLSLDDRMKR
jgi:hypothetical protein